jgi:2-polyprenyl-3-methyl-5-hydroxy-6-metoxy-1,4-benzoquinol methylase
MSQRAAMQYGTRSEVCTPIGQGARPSLPVEVIERGKREQEFFDRYTDPDLIPDELLTVPSRLDLPSEIVRLIPHLAGKRVCEYGCGYGVIAAYFASLGASTYGFDISESNIRVARRTARVNGVEAQMNLQVMQGECTSYPDGFFDLVFGNAVLHHLDLTLASREIFRMLKPGGVAVFLEPLGENKLLEWARRSSLRSSAHRHTRDERSLVYADLAALRSVFSRMSYREIRLFTVLEAAFRKTGAGMIGISRGERVLRYLARLDDWALEHVSLIRPLASYLVICLPKSGDANSAGSSNLGSILPSCSRASHGGNHD